MAWSKLSQRGLAPVPAPVADSEAPGADVIPIHGKTVVAATPSDVIRRDGFKPATPVADRPWRLLLVPPTPGARTRTFNVARWQAKLVFGAIGVLVLLAIADVTAIAFALRAEENVISPEEAAALRDGLLATEDSLNEARATLAASAEFTRDSIAASGAGTDKGRAAFLERRRSELALSRATRKAAMPSKAETRSIIERLPVIGAIASRFSWGRKHPILGLVRPHLGVDVAAPYGTRITAPAAGRVTFVGYKLAYGQVVEMEHPGGITTRYAHCSLILVSEGDEVKRGQLIATVGSSGLTTGPHLHYEVKVNGRNVDPMRFKMPQPADSAPSASGVAPQIEEKP
ncbi:MAG: M23 family metallopeptidase [Gemmatimonadota bacterium]